ncbi:MAG: MGH1-like glycoside hydrolase domain-containing protein [Alphaproteobacteria bacterium]
MSRYQEALQILKDNDRGEFSVPTHGLYPVQFNWDSAFAALGYRLFAPQRALREVELLLEGQWADGMVPHIVFRGEHDGYFPGPDVWSTGQPIPTSGITQPPVAGSVLRRLIETGVEVDQPRLATMVQRLADWHAWFSVARQCPDTGAIVIVHPWESGRDNLSDWDKAMAAVIPDTGLGEYKRRDLEHVDASQRPTKEEYDRYLTLVRFGRDCNWDQALLGRNSPFRMLDPGMTAMLLRAERDLIWLQTRVGQDISATQARIRRLEDGWRALWNPSVKGFTSLNQITGEPGQAVSSASFLGPYAGMLDHLSETLDHFDRIAARVKYMVPSFDPDAPGFDARRYWRGPVWYVVNNRIGLGLREIGELDRSERIRRDTAALSEATGFSEYYDPLTGDGLGGTRFTWSASVYLDWASEQAGAIASTAATAAAPGQG